MKNFMLLYMSSANADSHRAKLSPEEMEKMMAPWTAWFTKHASNVVEKGNPLGAGYHMTAAEGTPSTYGLNGYSIVKAEKIEDLKEMLSDHPYSMMPGGAVEVLEIMSM